MKIIEALKNLKTIQKRIEKNCTMIQTYSAYVSTETLPFESPEEQKRELQSLVQANIDLTKEYLRLKCAIELTNLQVKVTINGLTQTISELISIKRVVGKLVVNTLLSMSANHAMTRMREVCSKGVDPVNPAKLIFLYDEKEKNATIREYQEFLDAIDGKLEVVNAETDLVGL